MRLKKRRRTPRNKFTKNPDLETEKLDKISRLWYNTPCK